MERGPQAGAKATVSLRVDQADTAIAQRSGDVGVLATPRVLALAEEASVAALSDTLPPDRTTVGSWVELAHLRPTRVGATVHAEATLTGVDGRRLEFDVRVREGDVDVASVRHRRVIVRRDAFA